MRIAMMERIVREVLTEDEKSRSDNDRLVYLVAKKMNPNIDDFNMRGILMNKMVEFPRYETVTRCRRKIQAKNEELRATKDVQEYRSEQENTFKEYGRM